MKKLSTDCAKEITSSQIARSVASVIVELIENCIDANSKTINISLSEGGSRIIEVADDGEGISEDDLGLLCEGGTSKKKHVGTFGFRGMAMSAIFNLSLYFIRSNLRSVTVLSRRVGSSFSYRLTIVKDSRKVEKSSRNYGTTVTIRDLFEGTIPVRRKELLRTCGISSVLQALHPYLLAFPHIKFTLKNNGNISLQTNGGNLLDVILSVFGEAVANSIMVVEPQQECKFKISGIISRPSSARGRINRHFVCVNKRPCDLPRVRHLVNGIFREVNGSNCPFLFLDVESKSEVDFTTDGVMISHEDELLAFLKEHLSNLLNSFHPSPPVSLFSSKRPSAEKSFRLSQGSVIKTDQKFDLSVPQNSTPDFKRDNKRRASASQQNFTKNFHPYLEGQPHVGDLASDDTVSRKLSYMSTIRENHVFDEKIDLCQLKRDDFTQMEVIGQFNSSFIIVRLPESPLRLFIIDQHAADEKFKFEQLMARADTSSQPLIRPQRLVLGSLDKQALIDNLGIFNSCGFDFVISEDDVRVTRVPSLCVDSAIQDVEEMLHAGGVRDKVRVHMASRACRSAIFAGMTLSEKKMREVVHNLGTIDQPWNCPHGRPTIKHLITLSDCCM